MTSDAAQAVPSDAFSQPGAESSLSEVERLVLDLYGIVGAAKRLSSERDETFRFSAQDGLQYTLKIAHPAEDGVALQFQDDILRHLERVAPDLPVPRIIGPLQGGTNVPIDGSAARTRIVRLLTYLDGEQQYRTPASASQCRNIGRVLAELGLGLRTFKGPTPQRRLLWDISHTMDLKPLSGAVGSARRSIVSGVLDDFEHRAADRIGSLRRQVVHNDFNPHNVLVDPSSPDRVVGIIDFGDMVVAPLINELAVALAYHVSEPGWEQRASSLVEGYIDFVPLAVTERALLPVLIKARLAMTLIITEWRAAKNPDNSEYILRNHPSAWQGLSRLAHMSDADLRAVLFPHGEG